MPTRAHQTPVSPLDRARRWVTGRTGRRHDRTWRLRLLVQSGFAVTTLAIGWQFTRFLQSAQRGELPLPDRPAGVEGFLPISGLMGLKDWWLQGRLNEIHPAATVILLLVVAMSWLLRKAFCSWACPVGFLSEGLARLGRKLYGRNFRFWRWLDLPLRSLKYLLLGFFLRAIWGMDAAALNFFLQSPYNRVADVKMAYFFVDLSQVGLTVLLLLVVGSTFVQGLWCRYLCPYGALLGVFGWLSPTRVKREAASCVDCGLCDKVCMARLPVSTSTTVWNAECTGCLDCVAVCPVRDTLQLKTGPRRVPVWSFAAAVVLLFVGGYVGARVIGIWDTKISDQEYVSRVQNIDSSEYGHPGAGSSPSSARSH